MKRYGPALACACLVLVAGCGAGGDAQQDSAAEQVAALEAGGDIPALDRTAGLLGPDADGNGVRDDIDRYLAGLALEPTQASAAEQFARALQSTLAADPADEAAVRQAALGLSRAGQCLAFRHVPNRSGLITALEGFTADTRERSARYMGFNRALSGSVSRLLSGDTCDG
ncbi:hypothetical protein GCM10023144_13610 [Pigmentiphaga soli]|uniref:Uncharacterized protein n=1 Tax=Pigmentiphaga soli TaxID=1007095 RepID=A0ABP8GQE7_9BURK